MLCLRARQRVVQLSSAASNDLLRRHWTVSKVKPVAVRVSSLNGIPDLVAVEAI